VKQEFKTSKDLEGIYETKYDINNNIKKNDSSSNKLFNRSNIP